jgi:hypothetical protein
MLCDPDTALSDRAKKVFPECEDDAGPAQGDGGQETSTPSSSPRAITGMCSPPSGRCRRARMCMSRSPFRTTSGKAASSWRPPANTTASCQGGTQQRSDPLQDEIKAYFDAGRSARSSMCAAITTACAPPSASGDTPLTPPPTVNYDLWLGPAQDDPDLPQKVPLRLALGLEHRQRRDGQLGPAHPR